MQSPYFSNRITEHILNGVIYTPPNPWYLGVNDESGAGYARIAIHLDVQTSVGSGINSAAVAFPVALADWPEVTELHMYESASGGESCFPVTLNYPRTVKAGQRLRIGGGGVGYSCRNHTNQSIRLTDPFANQMFNWLFRGGPAILPGPVAVLLADDTKTEYSVGNGYARKSPASWVPSGIWFYINSTDMVWNVTGAWTPNRPPWFVGLANADGIITWGNCGNDSITHLPIPTLVAGDVLRYNSLESPATLFEFLQVYF